MLDHSGLSGQFDIKYSLIQLKVADSLRVWSMRFSCVVTWVSMLQKNQMLNDSRVSAIDSGFVRVGKSAAAIHLNSALVVYATLEFIIVGCSAYFASTAYHFITYNSLQAEPKYFLAAFVIAA